MEPLDWVLKIIGAAGGLIGTILGIYNFTAARKKTQQEEQSKLQEARDREMYIAFRARLRESDGNALMLQPEDDAELFWWAERMVQKGWLERGVGGHYYTLPQGVKW